MTDREQLLGRSRTCWSVLDLVTIVTFSNSAGEVAYDQDPLFGNSYDRAEILTGGQVKCHCVYQKPEGFWSQGDRSGNPFPGGHGGDCDRWFPMGGSLTYGDHPWTKRCRFVTKECQPCRYPTLDLGIPGSPPDKPCFADPDSGSEQVTLSIEGAANHYNTFNTDVGAPSESSSSVNNTNNIQRVTTDSEKILKQRLSCTGKTSDPTVPGCYNGE